MSKNKTIKLDDEVISILKAGYIENNIFFLPKKQLERQLYERVNQALVAMGGKWNRKSQGHIFEYDISDTLKDAIKKGSVINWKKETDFYYTPKEIVYKMIGLIQQYSNSTFSFLEPSCRSRTYIRYSKKRVS